MVGLVILATGSDSTVMVSEDLPSMVEDSDSIAIAGQAIMSGKYYKSPNKDAVLSNDDALDTIIAGEADNIMQKVEPDWTVTDSDGDGVEITSNTIGFYDRSYGFNDAEVLVQYLKSLSVEEQNAVLLAAGLYCPETR